MLRAELGPAVAPVFEAIGSSYWLAPEPGMLSHCISSSDSTGCTPRRSALRTYEIATFNATRYIQVESFARLASNDWSERLHCDFPHDIVAVVRVARTGASHLEHDALVFAQQRFESLLVRLAAHRDGPLPAT